MVNRLCKITLSVKDYQTQQKGSFTYNGEVISLDSNLKHYYYRFYETDAGTLSVSIDFSKPKIIIVEQSEQVVMTLGLNLSSNEKCIYQLDSNHHLQLVTKAWEIDIEEENKESNFKRFFMSFKPKNKDDFKKMILEKKL